MKIIILFISLIFCPLAFAGQVNVTTGFGYLKDSNGHIVSKAEYPIGTININDGWTYTEVADKPSLDAIVVYSAPVPPAQSFSTNLFVEQLAQTSLITDPSVLPYYAVLKDLTLFNNFQGLANLIAGLLKGGIINQTQVDTLDTVLENQQINLDSYNSEVNVAY